MGHDVAGFEINPYAAFSSRVKLDACRIDSADVRREIRRMKAFCRAKIENGYEPVSAPPAGFRTRRDFYSEAVLRKVLVLQDFVDGIDESSVRDLFQAAFASTMVGYSNYSYEPSLGTRKAAGKADVEDADVIHIVAEKVLEMAADIEWVQTHTSAAESQAVIYNQSFFECKDVVEASFADVAITSPPYLNNYHYIRNTRPQLYWLGYADRPKDVKPLETNNFGKFWQTVRDVDLIDLDFENAPEDLVDQIDHLRTLNTEKGVYGGNGWANYAASYFNDCYRFADGLMHCLRPGGEAYVVIGNSILQGIMIPTDVYLGRIAELVGLIFKDLRTPRAERVGNSIIQSEVRGAAAKKSDRLYEAVVVLQKQG